MKIHVPTREPVAKDLVEVVDASAAVKVAFPAFLVGRFCDERILPRDATNSFIFEFRGVYKNGEAAYRAYKVAGGVGEKEAATGRLASRAAGEGMCRVEICHVSSPMDEELSKIVKGAAK